jgi:hypothetical protein
MGEEATLPARRIGIVRRGRRYVRRRSPVARSDTVVEKIFNPRVDRESTLGPATVARFGTYSGAHGV